MKIKDSRVANVAIDVDAPASLGIFSKELLIMIKLILVSTANTMAKMNFQLKINRIIFSMFIKLPEIKDLSPSSTIDAVLAMQYIKIHTMINNINQPINK